MARSFNGSTDYLQTATFSSTTFGSGGWTFAGWFNIASFGTGTGLALFGLADGNTGFFVNNSPGQQVIGFMFGVGRGTGGGEVTGVWYHLCVVGTASVAGSGIFYKNGVQIGATFNPGAGSASTSLFAGFDAGGDAHFNGTSADCATWNVVLSAGEIAALAAGARPKDIRPANLFVYWPITGIQSPEPDYSGNARNGTVNGSPVNAAGPPIMQFTPRWPQRAAEAAAALPELQNFNAFVGRRVAVIGY